MTASTQVPVDSPLMRAWSAYKLTEEYANTKGWAGPMDHPNDNFWAVFSAGFEAAHQGRGATAEIKQLLKFYGATTLEELVATQARSIERLQGMLPRGPGLGPQEVRA